MLLCSDRVKLNLNPAIKEEICRPPALEKYYWAGQPDYDLKNYIFNSVAIC